MPIPARLPILYLILGVLILVSVVPLYFYGTKVIAINRASLKTNEQELQNTIARSLSDDLAQRHANLLLMLANLSSSIEVASGGNLAGENVEAPELRALLERFVTSTDMVAYATIINPESRGVRAGRIELDDFVLRQFEHAFAAAREGRAYTGPAISLGAGKAHTTVMVVSVPLRPGGRFMGMIATVVDLQFLIRRLRDMSTRGLDTYVVDRQGRVVAGGSPEYVTGRDMTRIEIVKNFVEQGSRMQLAATMEFSVAENNEKVDMLGTYSPVPALEWAVIAQKEQRLAYAGVYEMQQTARWLAMLAVLVSVFISIAAARKINTPLQVLTRSSRAIAKGDFSQRVHVKSRTEFGELAETFNIMTDDLERLVYDLKRAAEENRTLFLGSIQMLAGAVDEKDPYTKGHSDRVTRYSVILATEMGLTQEEIEKVRISAQLHDVGKIGIEDRILKKPGALTPDEFEIMKSHTTKGASILRPVEALREMLPGIELHHESLDGRGYPHGLKGDEIPLMPRIIAVADTFDAMTTHRPYQAAMDPAYVVRMINSLAKNKFDPQVVGALTAVFERGAFRIHRPATVSGEEAEASAVAATDGEQTAAAGD
jgi:HD-GYP domain-containing protein (c-di-GMP phosphodiesterase class II)